LFLLYAAQKMEHPEALNLAQRLGTHLINAGIPSLAGWGNFLSLLLFFIRDFPFLPSSLPHSPPHSISLSPQVSTGKQKHQYWKFSREEKQKPRE
jgi:hypothetical protein